MIVCLTPSLDIGIVSFDYLKDYSQTETNLRSQKTITKLTKQNDHKTKRFSMISSQKDFNKMSMVCN